MADRIIKPDSGNDVVIQNNGGTRKIEVTNTGDVEVTGDFKATTVKATNLKANDGTAGLVVADSTGRVTFSENNPVITLGSNTTFGSGVSLANASFPSGHVIQTKTDTFDPSSDQDATTTADDILGTNLQVTITPNSTSNKLVVTCFIGNIYTYASTNHSINAGFKYHADWSGTPATLGSREFITNQHLRHTDATVDMANFYFQTVADAPVTTSIIIRPWFKTNTGNVRLFDNQTMAQASLTVMEIQA